MAKARFNAYGQVQTFPVNLTAVTCGACGVVFGLESEFHEAAQRFGNSFRCPNPRCKWNSQSYTDTTEKDLKRARAQLEKAERRVQFEQNRRKAAERSASAHKAVATRRGNKIKRTYAGVCPCCNRSFKQLRRHMRSQHPEYVEKASSK